MDRIGARILIAVYLRGIKIQERFNFLVTNLQILRRLWAAQAERLLNRVGRWKITIAVHHPLDITQLLIKSN